jgi:hypothetical protein
MEDAATRVLRLPARGPAVSAPKVVRTTARPGRDRWYVDLQEDYTAGTEIVVLPAGDYDRMVEREREAVRLVKRLRELAEISEDFCDHDGESREKCIDCPDYRQDIRNARAFLDETKGETSDGK